MGIGFLLAQVSDDRQQAFLRSLNQSATTSVDGKWFVLGVAVIIALLTAAALYQRRARAPVKTSRKYLRNSRKLMKEMAASLELTGGEVRKLEHHAERLGVENPLTLMLCPSLLKRGEKKEEPAKADA